MISALLSRRLHRWICGWVLCALVPALPAQTLRMSDQLDRPSAGQAPSSTVDYIVALVNSEPVTNSEVRQRLVRVEQQYAQRKVALPPRDQLAKLVLEQLVAERAQQQEATELGVRVDDASMLQAEEAIAAQNQLSLEEFRRRVAAEGMDINRLRNEMRGQLLLQRVHDRIVQQRVNVTEADVDDELKALSASNPESLELNLSHVLIRVADDASPEQVKTLQARAQAVAERARAGEDFAALAREFSDAPEGADGGAFGWRGISRLPELFVQATRELPKGGIAGPVRSAAGFHVLRLNDKRQGLPPEFRVTQTRSHHILLRLGPQLSQAQAVAQLNEIRQQVIAGKARFEDLAREKSQDGSAREGGDLGWAVPGQFVPEFEEVMNALRPGEISQPLVSRFGVHLIRVDARREVDLTPSEQRDLVREQLRAKKADEVLQNWAQDVRARAFVEYREDPRP